MTWKIRLIGPTSAAWHTIAAAVEADLTNLQRPGVELSYRCTGRGPESIRSLADAHLAAPHVVTTARAAAAEGLDAVIIDCTDDPGLDAASAAVSIPVVGAGEALRAAVADAPGPVHHLSGDQLRTLSSRQLLRTLEGAATVALGATGFSDAVPRILAARPELVVIDPLPAALARCIQRLERRGD